MLKQPILAMHVPNILGKILQQLKVYGQVDRESLKM